MPDLVPVDYDPFGGRDDQSQSYGGPDPAQRMRELEQPGRDAIQPVSLIGEPAGAKDAADFAGQFGTSVALGTGVGQAARFAAPYVGRAASAGYQTMRDVMGDINGGMPLDKLGRINQLTGDRLAGEMGGRSAGEPSRSFASIAEGDTPPAAGVEPIRVYHASPHDFSSFDNSKIGTGEGAQAYSRGGYFGGAKKTADFYYDQFKAETGTGPQLTYQGHEIGQGSTAQPFRTGSAYLSASQRQASTDLHQLFSTYPPEEITPKLIDQTKTELRQRVNTYERMINEGRSLVNSQHDRAMLQTNKDQLALLEDPHFEIKPGQPGKAHMYEADLHVRPEQLGDYDKPLSQQSPYVSERLRGLMTPSEQARQSSWQAPSWSDHAAGTPYADATKLGTWIDSRASVGLPIEQQLREVGIPGVKYLDQGSRNLQLIPPDQTVHGQWLVKQVPNGQVLYRGPDEAAARAAYNPSHNYVIYDDKLIDIVKKYGVAGLGLPAGAGALIPVDHQPQF